MSNGQHHADASVFWGVGIVVVMLYALVPVVWIVSLSLKTPATITDGKFLPKDPDVRQLRGDLRGPRRLPPARCSTRSASP